MTRIDSSTQRMLDAQTSIGQILDDTAQRDAVHFALLPVVAGSLRLYPGQDIGFDADGEAITHAKPLGIVDPFLKAAVMPGERFWMFLYPNTITSLRHVWTHPDVDDATTATPPKAKLKQKQKQKAPVVSNSEQWLRDFAVSVDCSYDVLLEGAADYARSMAKNGYGDYLCDGGRWESVGVPDEFWPHYEAVTGKTVAEEHRGSFFSCSC